MLSKLRRLASSKPQPKVVSRPTYSSPTLEYGNSFCRLYNLDNDSMEAVRAALTFENPELQHDILQKGKLLQYARRIRNEKMAWVIKQDLEKLKEQLIVCFLKGNVFPTGHLRIVEEVLSERRITYAKADQRVRPRLSHIYRWSNKPPPLRPFQAEVIEIAEREERGVFACSVGSGKTRILTELIKKFESLSLIILPSAALVEQTQRVLQDAFGANAVGTLTTDKVKKNKRLTPIILSTIQTLASLQKQGLIQKAIHDVGFVYVDEFHHAGSESYTRLLPELDHVYYRFGGTGTFLRNDHRTMDLYGFLSNCIYHYSPQQAIADGFLTPVTYLMHVLPGTEKKNYQKEYEANLCGGQPLMNKIHEIVASVPPDEQVLILVDRKEKSGALISAYLKGKSINNRFISGDDKRTDIIDAIESFNDGDVRVLIGSTVVGEGVDIRATTHLILATGGKSTIKIVQALGRCVRLHPGKTQSFVYDFSFNPSRYMRKHAGQRISIFREYFAGDVRVIGEDDELIETIGGADVG